MADPISYNLHPSDIALEDTASYNQWFNAIVTLRDKASGETDSTRAAQYTEAMHGIVAKMEQDLSDDTSVVSVGPLIDMWEVEGKGSFGSFAQQMLEGETVDSYDAIMALKSFPNLTVEETQSIQGGLKGAHDYHESVSNRDAAYNHTKRSSDNMQGALWDQYDKLYEANPDGRLNAWGIWRGLSEPNNPIEHKIDETNQLYWTEKRAQTERTKQQAALQNMQEGVMPGMVTGTAASTKAEYDRLLEASLDLLGE